MMRMCARDGIDVVGVERQLALDRRRVLDAAAPRRRLDEGHAIVLLDQCR